MTSDTGKKEETELGTDGDDQMSSSSTIAIWGSKYWHKHTVIQYGATLRQRYVKQ